jgi:hypothetical protein
MNGATRASVSRATALLATVLCAFAILGPTTARVANGDAHTSIHLAKAVTAGSSHQNALTLRADQPHVISAGSAQPTRWATARATATSATIIPWFTADLPRMRGPPVHGCF